MNATEVLSPELHLMFRPAGAYRRLLEQPSPASARTLLRRPLFVALIASVAAALSSTARLSLGLVASSALCWSFVPCVQVGALAAVLPRGGPPRLPFARVVDLFFVGHAPWSLWLLAVTGTGALGFPEGWAAWSRIAGSLVRSSALVTAIWTASIAFWFFREVFGLSARRAAIRTALYEAIVWGVAIAYVAFVTQLWPRLLVLP